MNWINAFEILCYAVTLIFLVDIIQKKNREDFLLFVSAAFAGFALELLAVRVTDIYHYSRDFYISIGFEPYQFPLFGGLMWGGLTVYALRLAKRLKLTPIFTALVGGWLIVTMDLFLDVAAIRLNGGFWVWDGRQITLDITHHMFMSVIWVNFLGYMFETPAMIFISMLTETKRKAMPLSKQLLCAAGIGMAGIVFVGSASGVSLILNYITDEWFACITFVIVWTAILFMIIKAIPGLKFKGPAHWDWFVLIYWFTMYSFCIAALAHLGIMASCPLYFVSGIVLGIGTLILGMVEKQNLSEIPTNSRFE